MQPLLPMAPTRCLAPSPLGSVRNNECVAEPVWRTGTGFRPGIPMTGDPGELIVNNVGGSRTKEFDYKELGGANRRR